MFIFFEIIDNVRDLSRSLSDLDSNNEFNLYLLCDNELQHFIWHDGINT